MVRRVFALGLALLVALPAWSWNATGHRVVAAIAYDNLTPAAQARADELIRSHPDYRSIFVAGRAGGAFVAGGAVGAGAPDDARAAFVAASYWPDLIRSDPRFYDDTRQDAEPTPTLPGFPEMGRHTNWHYFDIPFSQDRTRTRDQRPPHALSEIQRLLRVAAGQDASQAAYALPWLLHLIGDVHNPMHATSRFSREHPDGDQGGNLVFVSPGGNLHAFWDGLAGDDIDPDYVRNLAAGIMRDYRANGGSERVERNPGRWIEESAELAKSRAYAFGSSSGTRAEPIVLSDVYVLDARRVARQRLALAGLRLAAVLNNALAR